MTQPALDALTLRTATSVASVVPARGAIVTRWATDGREHLYLDEATLADPTKNVRGGVPLLFPSPGKLADGRYARGGKSGAMKQHGFARDLPWTVTTTRDAGVTLELASSDATRAIFAWDFLATLEVTLSAAALKVALRVENRSSEAMPFAFGLHPYFRVHDKARATISTAATQAYDNLTAQVRAFQGFDLASGETDLHLVDHGSTESTLTADGQRVTVRGSAEMRRWVVWTLPGKDFVCLEPWSAPGDALNTGAGLIELAPGAAKDLWVELSASALHDAA